MTACGARFRAVFRVERCERPAGHPGPHALVDEDGKVRVDRETRTQRRERLLREEGVAVP